MIPGMIGLNQITDSITALRLSETWDDFNEARMDMAVTPANIILRGFISDFRVSGYIDLMLGIFNIAFFGICVLQACIVLRIFQPLTEQYMVDTIAWTSLLLAIKFVHSVIKLWRSMGTTKAIYEMKHLLTIFPRGNKDDVLDIFHDSGFYSGPHVGLLVLSPEFTPAIEPSRQISFELSRINKQLDRIICLHKSHLRAICERAADVSEVDSMRYFVEGVLQFFVALTAFIGFPYHYYNAAYAFKRFGTDYINLVELLRNVAVVVDGTIAQAVIQSAMRSGKSYKIVMARLDLIEEYNKKNA